MRKIGTFENPLLDRQIQEVVNAVQKLEIMAGGTWTATTVKSKGQAVRPTTHNGFYYRCDVAGTTGAGEPTWPTTLDGTVTDNTVTWICAGTIEPY